MYKKYIAELNSLISLALFNVTERNDFDWEWKIWAWPLLPGYLAQFKMQACIAEKYSYITAALHHSLWECSLCFYSNYCTFSPETFPRQNVGGGQKALCHHLKPRLVGASCVHVFCIVFVSLIFFF